MKNFAFCNALTPASAAELAGKDGRYLAGGIDLLGELKEYLVETPRVVNVKTIRDSAGAEWTPTSLRLGTNTTISNIAADPKIHAQFPGLAEAASEVGSPQIRAVATLGGNLAQHSRCWYYRHRDVSCLKKGGSTCHAREGLNKFHSIFSGNPCISPIVSNLGVTLATLDARVIIQRGKETLRPTIDEFYAPAWENPLAHNLLKAGDLILAVEIPIVAGQRSAYVQVSEKSDFDWALVSAAASGVVLDGKFSSLRLALGAVSPIPHRNNAAEKYLEGKTPDETHLAKAAELLLENAAPLADNGYKIPIAQALIKRALRKLTSA